MAPTGYRRALVSGYVTDLRNVLPPGLKLRILTEVAGMTNKQADVILDVLKQWSEWAVLTGLIEPRPVKPRPAQTRAPGSADRGAVTRGPLVRTRKDAAGAHATGDSPGASRPALALVWPSDGS